MRVKVVGAAGMMGEAMAYAFLKMGCKKVWLSDVDTRAVFETFKRLSDTRVGILNSNRPFDLDGKPLELVISAAPYNVNIDIAKQCNLAGVPYADLGGNPDVSRTIQENAAAIYPEEKWAAPQAPVFTDLGLAPGWASIIAEQLIRNKPYQAQVKMYVGGLPREPEALPWKYGIVFSPKGLYNEYTGPCEYLGMHVKCETPALSGHHYVSTLAGELEAFNTKGGMGLSVDSLAERGVRDAQYFTLRYKGHHDILNNLLNEHRYTEEQFTRVLLENCPVITDDIVVMKVVAKWDGKPLEKVTRQVVVLGDDRFTAMAKATAFPAAVAAKLMADGTWYTGEHAHVCEYKDVPCGMFNHYLKELGLIR